MGRKVQPDSDLSVGMVPELVVDAVRPLRLAKHRRVVDRFPAALGSGDLQVLLEVLAPGVVLVAG